MNTELEALEIKVEQALEMIHQLQAENEVLRNRIAAADTERLDLRQKISAARERLETLMDKLPEES
ncbi:MAG: hypothetical protein ACM3SV_13965 [Betaproteobacteria bacterium]